MQQFSASRLDPKDLGGGAEFQQIVKMMIGSVNTGELVKVIAVEASGLNPVGFVSVQPLVMGIDADNNNIEKGEINNVPYFRISGGTNAVICDPEIGDIGFCGFCSRDISIVKRIREMAGTNVYRTSDVSDAFFFGGWSAKQVEQYIWFKGGEVHIKAKSKVVIDAPETHCTGNITAAGTITDLASSGGVTMNSMRENYNSHVHKGNGQGNDTSTPNIKME